MNTGSPQPGPLPVLAQVVVPIRFSDASTEPLGQGRLSGTETDSPIVQGGGGLSTQPELSHALQPPHALHPEAEQLRARIRVSRPDPTEQGRLSTSVSGPSHWHVPPTALMPAGHAQAPKSQALHALHVEPVQVRERTPRPVCPAGHAVVSLASPEQETITHWLPLNSWPAGHVQVSNEGALQALQTPATHERVRVDSHVAPAPPGSETPEFVSLLGPEQEVGGGVTQSDPSQTVPLGHPQLEVSHPLHAPHAPQPVPLQMRERSRVCWPTPLLQLVDSVSVEGPPHPQLLPSQTSPLGQAQPLSSHAPQGPQEPLA